MVTCTICNKEFKKLSGVSRHVMCKHNIKPKDYYDKYLKKEYEGICPNCGNETHFENITNGYRKYCSAKCSANSKTTKDMS